MVSLHQRYIHEVFHFVVNLQCLIHNVNADRNITLNTANNFTALISCTRDYLTDLCYSVVFS